MPSSDHARQLRRNQTQAEMRLWQYLRARRLGNYKFRRQHPIGNRITDFCCLEKQLILELDGGQHTSRELADRRRTEFLQGMGYRVLRIWNNELTPDIGPVLDLILEELEKPFLDPREKAS